MIVRFLGVPLLVILLAGCSRVGPYPSRPITIICPWAAGGGTDRVSRQVAHLLKLELGVPVDVQNAVGGEGVTGHTKGAHARADGYTLTMMTPELNVFHWRGLTTLTHTDFQPAVLLNEDAAAIFVRRDSKLQDLKALEERLRSGGEPHRASGTAKGGIWHLALIGWIEKAGIPMNSVIWQSMGGAMPSLTELLAEGVDFVCCSLPEANTFLKDDRVRCLGVMAEERVPGFPSVPTFREQGADWTLVGWRGIGLPRETPPEIVQRVAQALERVARSEPFLAYMKQEGFNAQCRLPVEFKSHLGRVDGEMEKIVRTAFASVGEDPLGPMFFPSILGAGLLVVCAALLFTGGLRREAGGPTDPRGRRRMLEVLAAVTVYILAAEHAGFLLTAGLIVFALCWRLGAKPWIAALLSLILVPAVYQVFAIWMRVPLPVGWVGWM